MIWKIEKRLFCVMVLLSIINGISIVFSVSMDCIQNINTSGLCGFIGASIGLCAIPITFLILLGILFCGLCLYDKLVNKSIVVNYIDYKYNDSIMVVSYICMCIFLFGIFSCSVGSILECTVRS